MWVVCYDEAFYPDVEAYDTEEEAKAKYDDLVANKEFLDGDTTIYMCKVIKSE